MSHNYVFMQLDYSYNKVTSHYNRLSIFKIHRKEFSISFKCYSFKFVCSNLPTMVGLRIIMYMCAGFTRCSRFVSTSSTQIVPKGTLSARRVGNFSEVIRSDQSSPQQMQCKYHMVRTSRPTLPNSGTWCSYDRG